MPTYGVHVDPDAPFKAVPNEVLRMILLHLTALGRKGVARVSKMWRLLRISTPDIEMPDLGCALLNVVAEGDLNRMIDSILSIESVKAEWKEKESWRRMALRVAAKKGHFNCMATLLNTPFNSTYAPFNCQSTPIFYDALDEEQNDDKQTIEKNIDAITPVEDDLEKLTSIFKDKHRGEIWQKTHPFRAVKVFIENNQVNCVEFIFSVLEKNKQYFPLEGLEYIIKKNRPQCLTLFLKKYGCLIQNPTWFFIGLGACSRYAKQEGYNECAELLEPYISHFERKRGRENDLNEEVGRPRKTFLLSRNRKDERHHNEEGDNKNNDIDEEVHCRIC